MILNQVRSRRTRQTRDSDTSPVRARCGSVVELACGATAVLHPMGLTRPADALCARALQRIVAGFACSVLSCPPAVYRALTDEAVQHVEAQQQLEHALDAALAQADAPAPRAALPMGMPMFF